MAEEFKLVDSSGNRYTPEILVSRVEAERSVLVVGGKHINEADDLIKDIQNKIRERIRNSIPVIIDMRHKKRPKVFYETWLKKVLEECCPSNEEQQEVKSVLKREDTNDSEIGDILKRMSNNSERRLVLLLNHFDSTTEANDFNQSFFDNLRNLRSQQPSFRVPMIIVTEENLFEKRGKVDLYAFNDVSDSYTLSYTPTQESESPAPAMTEDAPPTVDPDTKDQELSQQDTPSSEVVEHNIPPTTSVAPEPTQKENFLTKDGRWIAVAFVAAIIIVAAIVAAVYFG